MIQYIEAIRNKLKEEYDINSDIETFDDGTFMLEVFQCFYLIFHKDEIALSFHMNSPQPFIIDITKLICNTLNSCTYGAGELIQAYEDYFILFDNDGEYVETFYTSDLKELELEDYIKYRLKEYYENRY